MTRKHLAVLAALGVAALAYAWSDETRNPSVRREARTAALGEVSLFFVGDLMPGRGVDRARTRHEPGWLFSGISDAARAADIAVANLEAPIVAGTEVLDGAMRLRADPGVERDIADAGFDLLSLANNHALDEGVAGLRSTRERVEGQGMAQVGSGDDETEARSPRTFERNGLKISFFAYVDPSFTRVSDRARPDGPGLAFMDAATVAADIASASASDIIVVIMHAGVEYDAAPGDAQRAFARAAIDGGADLVIGHHPHVVQPAELYKDRPILYSLGNFVFDQGWSDDASLGLAADVRVRKDGVTGIAWRPIVIDASGQPRFAEGEAARKVLERVGPLADDMVTFAPR